MNPSSVSGAGPPVGDWGMQQVAGFLAAISTLPDEGAMLRGAVHRIAEAVDAEVCALASPTDVLACVGFPADQIPVTELLEVAHQDRATLHAPSLGELDAVSIDLHLDTATRLVVARSDEPLDRSDVHVLRTMAQVLDLAVSLRRAADRERDLREASEAASTELRRINARLEDASRVKSDLISMASHELRTPLTSIIGFTELMRRHWDRLPEDDRLQHLDRVHHHGRRLLRLVDDLLLVGRIDSGATAPAAIDLDVARACAMVIGEFHEPVELTGELDQLARVDADHFEQVITNLLTNASKYGAAPFRIDIGHDPTGVRVAVCDHGDGVPEDFEPRLFERFAQASTGDSRSGSGTGLGLAIVDGLLEANGGAVRYERRDGTTRFVVTLPSSDPATDGPRRAHVASGAAELP